MNRLVLALATLGLLLGPPAAAQDAPSGFKIRIAPDEGADDVFGDAPEEASPPPGEAVGDRDNDNEDEDEDEDGVGPRPLPGADSAPPPGVRPAAEETREAPRARPTPAKARPAKRRPVKRAPPRRAPRGIKLNLGPPPSADLEPQVKRKVKRESKAPSVARGRTDATRGPKTKAKTKAKAQAEAKTKAQANAKTKMKAAEVDDGSQPSEPTPKTSKTRWGPVETVTPLEAARRRDAAGGQLIEFSRSIGFTHDTIDFANGAQAALAEVGDYLQATPEIRLVLVEGHTDATGSLRYNQKLSEARATTVRHALIERGVAPERLLAYGYGETRPAAEAQDANRRVVFRIVEADRKALVKRAATDWAQAGVVGLQGEVSWASSPESDADDASDAAEAANRADAGLADAALEWSEVSIKQQLDEGVDIRTAPGGQALLRLPDLTRVWLGSDTRVRLSKLYFDQREAKAYTALRVRRGTVRMMVNPLERGRSRTLVAFTGGAIEGTVADLELQVTPAGIGRLRLDRGSVQASVGGARSVPVRAGQHLRVGLPDAAPVPQLAAPIPGSPIEGTFDKAPALSWSKVSTAMGYVVEIAADVDFHQPLIRARTVEPSFDPRVLEAGRTYYWRVMAVDPAGLAGAPSRIHAFRVARRIEAPTDGVAPAAAQLSPPGTR